MKDETGGLLFRANLLAVAFSAALVSGCALASGGGGRPEMTLAVRTVSDPEWPGVVQGRTTFSVSPLKRGTGDELQEKQLLFYLRERLALKGLVYTDQKPDLTVAITAFIGPFEHYVPPSTFYWPMPTSSTSTTTVSGAGLGAGSAVANTTTHGEQYVPIQRPGYTVVRYFRSITIFIGRPKADGEGADPLWQGTADSSGELADLIEVAPTLVRHMLTEFPRRSGLPSQRVVRLIRMEDP